MGLQRFENLQIALPGLQEDIQRDDWNSIFSSTFQDGMAEISEPAAYAHFGGEPLRILVSTTMSTRCFAGVIVF